MSKIDLDTIATGYNLTKINSNFQKIEDELNDKVLYRDNIPNEPNYMLDTLDMNGQRVINLPAPISNSEPVRLQDLVNSIAGIVPASVVPFSPYLDISSTNVQGAIQEVKDDVVSVQSSLSSTISTFISNLASSVGSSLVGFIQAGTGAVARTLQSKIRDNYVSVKDFGAVGDGVTDDTAAINNAILAVEAKGGGTVFFPATDYSTSKWYRCNGTIFLSATRDVELLGDGNTMIKSHASSTATDLLVIGDPTNVQQRSSFVKVNNLKLWSATALNGNGIRARKVTNLRIGNCSIFNHGVNGMYFSDTYTFHMEDSESVGNVLNGLLLDSAGANNSSITRSRFNSNNTSNTALFAGIRILGLHYNVIIDKCDFEFNNRHGIYTDGSHAVNITQNYFELNTSACVFMPPGSTNRGVMFSGNSVFTTLCDFNNVSGITIEGNVFELGGTALNIGSCTEVDIGSNSFPSGGSIATDNNGKTDFSSFSTWITYTPTWTGSVTNPVLGNGSIAGSFKRIGKTCHLRIVVVAGSTTTFGSGSWLFALPFAAVTSSNAEWFGKCTYTDSSASVRRVNDLTGVIASGLSVISLQNNDGSSVTATSPITWATSDTLQFNIVYETV